MTSVTVQGLDDLNKLAAAYKTGDRKIRAAIGKGLRVSAAGLGPDVVTKGAADMPQRGGLAARIAASRAVPSVSLGSKYPSVRIRIVGADGIKLRFVDGGRLRHPVYGNRHVWVSQEVPAKAFTEAFEAGAPEVRERVREAVQQALAEIAREAT